MNMFRNIPFHPQWIRKFKPKKNHPGQILVNIFNLLTLNKISLFWLGHFVFIFWPAVSANEKIPQFYTYQFFM